VVLLTTARAAAPGFARLAIGVGLVVIRLGGIPLTRTSVHPSRSLGPALFVVVGALSQAWVFILPPLRGGFLAALLAPALHAGPDAKDDPDPTDAQVPVTGSAPTGTA